MTVKERRLLRIRIVLRILSSLRSLTVDLQKKANDILAAYEHIMLELELLKTNCEEEFHSWFETFADDLSIPVCTLRIAVHRAMFQLIEEIS